MRRREIGAILVAVLPDQVDVVDADDLVAVDVDDLLVEQVALQQEIALVLGQGRRAGGLAELHGAAGSELELGDGNQRRAVAAFGRGQTEDDAVDVGGIDRGSDGELADVAEGAPWASTTAEPMRAETLVL